MLSDSDKQCLDQALIDELNAATSVVLAIAVSICKVAVPNLRNAIDGMVVSKALRRLGFSRDYDHTGPGIVYRRASA